MGVLTTMMTRMMALTSPHMRQLGIRFLSADKGVVVGMLPYRDDLVGDPQSGVLHGGVVTTLLDSTAGASVMTMLLVPGPIATLDLRIDYLRPSTPRAPLYARVECYTVTRHVAFTRGIAYNTDERDAVASMAATFMLQTQAVRVSAERGDG